MAADIYLADTTVYVLQDRYPQVRRRFTVLLSCSPRDGWRPAR